MRVFRLTRSAVIEAPPEVVWRALFSIRLSDMRVMRLLFWLRSLPAWLKGGEFKVSEDIPLYEGIQRRFAVLTQVEPEVIEIGRIAKFWHPIPAEGPLVADRAEFEAFCAPDYAKAVMTFLLEPEQGGTRLTNKTTVVTTDSSAAWKFGAYWFAIRPGVAAVRRGMFGAVRRAVRPGA